MDTTSWRPRTAGVAWMLVALLATFSVTCAPRLSASARRWPWLPKLSEAGPAEETVTIRGHVQVLRVYGPRNGTPVVVSSGDGGWFHLAPRVATLLAARGCFVVGFNVRAYLAAFTTGATTLRLENVPRDYEPLIAFASRETGRKPILVGVSEGAGLSVLAGADPLVKSSVAGVIALGLPDSAELGWRWRDSVIYFTHRSPNEPLFSVRTIVDRLAPLPLAAIHSTNDEYAPLVEARQILDRAQPPKRLWIVNASNHRFSGNPDGLERALREAMNWIGSRA